MHIRHKSGKPYLKAHYRTLRFAFEKDYKTIGTGFCFTSSISQNGNVALRLALQLQKAIEKQCKEEPFCPYKKNQTTLGATAFYVYFSFLAVNLAQHVLLQLLV